VLQAMRRHGREPMSMTHGDVDDDYLERLVLDGHGKRRLDRVSFAAHFDKQMFGRRGIERPASEAELNPYRERFAAQARRLRREHGVRVFLAHNMTVTPANLDEVADVIRSCRAMGYGMFSFQPAAYVGDARRWREGFRQATSDAVWAEVEAGAGAALDHHLFEHGDTRCNRVAYGSFVGDRYVAALDGADPRDVAARDAFLHYFHGVNLTGPDAALTVARAVRVVASHPRALAVAAGWALRAVRRAGGPTRVLRAALARQVHPVTFVMHSFIDAADVAPAWELLQQGVTSDDPAVRGTQERLQACHYAMAHPEDGTIVPACVQHSLLDPDENAALRRLLPLTPVASARGGR